MIKPKATPAPAVQTEAEWEEKAVAEALGDALNADGTIDFDKLEARSHPITLEELYPEGDADDES